jgi:hypothetical protein
MKNPFRSVELFFDRLEDAVRGKLSKHPFVYGFVGGSGVILFWRGVWHTADYLEESTEIGAVVFSDVGSMLTGIVILLMSGLFVSVFIGDSILISGLKKEKKLTEKTEEEVVEHASDRIRTGMPGGGYILSTACSVAPKVAPWKLEMLTPLAEELGQY